MKIFPKLDIKFEDIDFHALREDLSEVIRNSVEGLVQGAADDLRVYGNAIADDVIRVMQVKDVPRREALLRELLMQVRLVGEINRLKAEQANWDMAVSIIGVVAKTAIKFVIP